MAEQKFFGKYLIQREIARGGMGVVYLALDQSLDRQVGIKVLHAHYMGDASFAQRFLREARAMARLNHENIIQIYAVEEDQGHHYIVMEYFPSKELKQLLKEGGPLDLGSALRYAIAMIRALICAHEKGIIHRDVKPGNMMIGEGDLLKLTDFGIAAALGESSATVTGTVMGTPEYMSPEQARGDRVATGTDFYSLGVVLYEMLTGTTPYKGRAGQSIVGKLAYDPEEVEWNFPEHVPTSLQYLIRSMTERKLEQRFTDANLILETLKNHLDQLSSVVPPPSPTSDDATIALSPSMTTVLSQSQPHAQREREKPVIPKPQEPSVVGPQGPSTSKPLISPPLFRRVIMAVVASVFIVGGVLLVIHFWPTKPGPEIQEITKSGESVSVIPENPSVDILAGKMDKLADQWEVLLAQHKTKVQQSDVDLVTVERRVDQLKPAENQQLNLQVVKDVKQQVEEVNKAFQQASFRYQKGVKELQASTKGLLTEMEGLKNQGLDGPAKDWFSQASRKLQDLAKETARFQADFEGTWDKRLVGLRQSVAGLKPAVVVKVPKPVKPKTNGEKEKRKIQQQVDSLVAQMGKLGSQWEALLVKYKSRVQQANGDLADVEGQVDHLGRAENQQLTLSSVEKVRQQAEEVDQDFQKVYSQYQGTVTDLQEDNKRLLTEAEVLQGQKTLAASAKALISQASQTLQNQAAQAIAYQQENKSAWFTQIDALGKRVDGLNRRVVELENNRQRDEEEKRAQTDRKEQEKRDLQQRVDALIVRIDDVGGKVKGTGKAQLMSSQSFQKQIHDLEQNIGSLSTPNRQKLDGLSQTLTKLNAEFQRDQERFRDELKKYHQNLQEFSSELKLLQTSEFEVSTFKKVVTLVQALEEMFKGIEESQKEANLTWNEDMANIQGHLLQFDQAVVPGGIGNVQDAERKKLEMIVRDLQQLYQNRDLAAFQLATDLSPKHVKVLEALFANWPSFTVHTHIDSIDQESAKVVIQLHDMVDKRGKRAKPRQEEIIGRQVLLIPHQGGEWGKPQW